VRDIFAILDFAAHVFPSRKIGGRAATRLAFQSTENCRGEWRGKGNDARAVRHQVGRIVYGQSINVMRHIQHDFDHAHPYDDWKIRK
jgi:hypothetical protein